MRLKPFIRYWDRGKEFVWFTMPSEGLSHPQTVGRGRGEHHDETLQHDRAYHPAVGLAVAEGQGKYTPGSYWRY